MCAPKNTDVLYQLPEMPLYKCASTIILECGNTTHAPSNTKKRSFDNIAKTALFCGSCFAVLLLRGSDIFSSNAMGNQIDTLIHDLDSFNRLKKELVDDELELNWDRQHMSELDDNIESMKGSFERLTHFYHQEEADLGKKNESLREALIISSDPHSSVHELDRDVFLQLSKQAGKVQSELDHEMAENAALKKRLAETITDMQNALLPVPEAARAALRGSSLNVN
mmetsp:Transcript_8482/g.18987  ORF Transcript_8482/g.18987 Transcript_8482/m.18987 type:complete len:225 (-) Transcript_8482:154-828(-)